MSQVWLISGSPGCGKTNWILNTFKNYSGNCGYLRLGGYSEINLEQAINSKIDFAFLKDQIPNLLDLSISNSISEKDKEKILIIIEFPTKNTRTIHFFNYIIAISIFYSIREC